MHVKALNYELHRVVINTHIHSVEECAAQTTRVEEENKIRPAG